MENQETKFQTDIDWEQRKLCSDESCIGVIGPDGRCKECGLPFEEGPSGGIVWEQRTLCSDESCIGVIGPDGRCKECGKPYET